MAVLSIVTHLLIQIVVFGLALLFSLNFRPPQHAWGWLALLGLVFGADYIGAGILLIELPELVLRLSDVLEPLGLGVLGGLILREHALVKEASCST